LFDTDGTRGARNDAEPRRVSVVSDVLDAFLTYAAG
jgi:hypothetical protein